MRALFNNKRCQYLLEPISTYRFGTQICSWYGEHWTQYKYFKGILTFIVQASMLILGVIVAIFWISGNGCHPRWLTR